MTELKGLSRRPRPGTADTALRNVLEGAAAATAAFAAMAVTAFPSAGLGGDLSVMPLGVTGLGALALAAVLLIPLRHRPPLTETGLFARAVSAVVAFVSLAGVAAAAGHGTIFLSGGGLQLHRAAGGLGDQRARQLMHGASQLTFGTDLLPTLGRGVVTALALIAVCWLGTGEGK